jgi:signal transduction histidine kinase
MYDTDTEGDYIATTKKCWLGCVYFRDPVLEKMFRDSCVASRAQWGRKCSMGMLLAITVIYLIAISNQSNVISTLQYATTPLWCLLSLAIIYLSHWTKTELQHQILWCIAGSLAFIMISLNEIMWTKSFLPEIQEVLREFENKETHMSDPISLFYLTETGWFLTAALVFFSLMVRPRQQYLYVMTIFAMVSFLGVAVHLRDQIVHLGILLRVIVFAFCCAFNAYASWVLDNTDRKAYFLSIDLARKLASEKEKLRQEAEAKSEAQRIIVAYLCHEIRNPFNGVLGFAELIESALQRITPKQQTFGLASSSQIREVRKTASGHTQTQPNPYGNIVVNSKLVCEVKVWCRNIVLNSRHILDILDNVLDLSKLEEGTLVLCQSPMRLRELADQISSLLQSIVRSGVSFVITVEPENIMIQGDHQRWKQLLVNLVSNAIKFTYEGFVMLRISRCRMVPKRKFSNGLGSGAPVRTDVTDVTDLSDLLVEVCDTGVGISEREQQRLFQKYRTRYHRLPFVGAGGNTTTTSTEALLTKGTGLGLVIAQRIANLLGTQIELESPWLRDEDPPEDQMRRADGTAGNQASFAGSSACSSSAAANGNVGSRFFFTVRGCILHTGTGPAGTGDGDASRGDSGWDGCGARGVDKFGDGDAAEDVGGAGAGGSAGGSAGADAGACAGGAAVAAEEASRLKAMLAAQENEQLCVELLSQKRVLGEQATQGCV